MKNSQSEQSTLGYLQQVLDHDRRAPFPPTIALLWAAICLAGFLMMDVSPEHAGSYWMTVPVAGFLLSAWLGNRAGRASGELDRRAGLRWMKHFGVLLVAMFIAGGTGLFNGLQLGVVALLLTGTVYLLAGVHLATPLTWVGILLLAGIPVVLLMDAWRWTIVGVLVAIALTAVAVWNGNSGIAGDD